VSAVVALKVASCMLTVVDTDQDRIARWGNGQSPIHEAGLREILDVVQLRDSPVNDIKSNAAAASAKQPKYVNGQSLVKPVVERKPNLTFSFDVEKGIKEADVIIIAVDTPQFVTSYSHSTDLAREVFGHMNLSPDGYAGLNLTSLASVVIDIAKNAVGQTTVVLKSTVPCSTTSAIGQYVWLSKYSFRTPD
jgi:UDP-glucose 6-dehydrogenase